MGFSIHAALGQYSSATGESDVFAINNTDAFYSFFFGSATGVSAPFVINGSNLYYSFFFGRASAESNVFELNNSWSLSARGISNVFRIDTRGSSGDSSGDSGMDDRFNYGNTQPIVLLNGISPASLALPGATGGPGQWDQFVLNFTTRHPEYRKWGMAGSDDRTTVLYVCDRLDTSKSAAWNAQRLNDYLASVKDTYPMKNARSFTLLGYSYGGLIARAWEAKYDSPVEPGGSATNVLSKRVSQIVTVNTPHAGSLLADAAFALLNKLHIPPEPVVYELMTLWPWKTYSGTIGTRYSLIGSDVGFVWPPLLTRHHDVIVPLSSQLHSSWASRSSGNVWQLGGLAHVGGVGGMGFPGVLSSMDTVDAVWNSLRVTPSRPNAKLEGSGMLASLDEAVSGSDGPAAFRRVLISSGTTTASLGGRFVGCSGLVTLVPPRGAPITPATVQNYPNIQYQEGLGSASYVVSGPTPGSWTIEARFGEPEGELPAGFNFLASDDGACVAESESPRVVHQGESGRVLVRLAAGGTSATTCTVEALAISPTGAQSAVAFYDDGSHGDGGARDGLFGSEPLVATEVGDYVVKGRIYGALPTGGYGSRTFACSFVGSPDSGRIVELAGVSPVDGTATPNGLYDILNVVVNLNFAKAGEFTLVGELADAHGNLIDSDVHVFHVDAAGPLVKPLRFKGEVIGEYDVDGPYTVRNVRLEENLAESTLVTDFVDVLGVTEALSRFDFETIHQRAVAPPEAFRKGMNFMSFPLEPLEGVGLRDVLGPGAVFLPTKYGTELPARGKAFFVNYMGEPQGPIYYLGSAPEASYAIPLAKAGPQQFGCPYNNPVMLIHCSVKNLATGVTRTAFEDANSTTQWIRWDFQYLLGGKWRTARLGGGDDDFLRPWFGYKVTTNVGNLELIVPR